MRYQTTITGPAPDSEYDRAKALIESRELVAALEMKLQELLGGAVLIETKWIKEVERKPKAVIPGNPGGAPGADTQVATGAALADKPAARHHGTAAERTLAAAAEGGLLGRAAQ